MGINIKDLPPAMQRQVMNQLVNKPANVVTINPAWKTATHTVRFEVESHPSLFRTESTDEKKLNKSERAWLEILRRDPELREIGIQNITLKLADDCRYTPDFTFLRNGQLYAHEYKGFWRDDAKVKIKVAARMYRWIRFVVIQKVKGEFVQSEVKP